MRKLLSQINRIVMKERLFSLAILIAVALLSSGYLSLRQIPRLVEWETVGALFGLLILSCALEESGFLQRLGDDLLKWTRTERGAALILVAGAAALSMVITNDIALFVVVPMTLALGSRLKGFPLGRLIIFEALAVNAGSMLSPIGNPQNLFLWQQSRVSFFHFVTALAPLAGALMGILAVTTWLAFSGDPLVSDDKERPRVSKAIAAITLFLYPAFVVAVEFRYLLPAIVAIVLLQLLILPRVFRSLDWALLLLFAFMFVDLRAIASIPAIHHFARNALSGSSGGYEAGILFSQGISNVPAAVLLQSFHPSWKELAWGVNVGGFGLLIGSLANLIALRLSGIRGLWREFHLWSLPMLGVSYLIGHWLL